MYGPRGQIFTPKRGLTGLIIVILLKFRNNLERVISLCAKNVEHRYSTHTMFDDREMNTYYYMIFVNFLKDIKGIANYDVMELSFF